MNINKLPIQNLKKTLSVVFLLIFILLLVLTLLENITYNLVLSYVLQVKSLLAVLLTTLKVLPVSIFDKIISLKNRVANY